MKYIFITGSNGFLGSKILDYLLKINYLIKHSLYQGIQITV